MFRRINYLIIQNQNDENDRRENKLKIVRMRKQLRDKSNPLSLPNHIFIQRFRINKEAFLMILQTVNLDDGCRSTRIPPILRLCATLETLGSGGYQWLTGDGFGIALAQSTLSKIVTKTAICLESILCPVWIKWSISNEVEKTKIKQWFYQKYSLPGIVGCIDGTHLFFQRPKEDEHIFFNRKGKHSLNAMIICDNMRIMAVNARYGGSAHDSLVWKHSNERLFFENAFSPQNHNYWLLGDSGYPLEPWLLAPYRSSDDATKTHFNSIHAKARNIVERCIGVYKGRWRILLEERKSSYSPDKIAVFANVCAALHNICIQYNVVEHDIILSNDNIPNLLNESEESNSGSNEMRRLAVRIRDNIKNSL